MTSTTRQTDSRTCQTDSAEFGEHGTGGTGPRRPPIRTIGFLATGVLALLLGPVMIAAGFAAPGTISQDGLWTEIEPATIAASPTPLLARLQAYRMFELQEGELQGVLDQAPMEFTPGARSAHVVMTLPMPDGTYSRFRIEESPIMSPELAAQYPEIKTYQAQGIDDPTATMRFDRTPAGFHAMVLSVEGAVFVDPYQRGDTKHYISYFKRDLLREAGDFECLLSDVRGKLPFLPRIAVPSGNNLRTYRLAVTATGEYTTFFGGTAQAQAQITTTVNRVNGIYEREVAIRLNLTATAIFTNPATDPIPNTTVNSALLNRNQVVADSIFGSANYDIGHLLNAGPGGGLAGLGVVCGASKARAATSTGNPSGDAFDVDFVAHEIGHQFNGNHTFNGTTNSCSGGNRNAGTAYEPGSGTTIMAYAGICGAENVQANSDAFFHTISFDEITAFRDAGGSCGVQTATGNNPPTVNAGPNYTIPTDTPFMLTATGNDADGDALTFSWEQFDLGNASPPANNANGPLFRSRAATTSPSRTFPRLQDILSGVATPWEFLPTVARTLNFRVTARDNRAGGGGVDYDSMTLTVSGAPFAITSPNGGETLGSGCEITVAWNVGGGSVASNVNILLSVDGGNSFASLLSNTPNDGSQSVTLPCVATSTARIRVEPTDNVFFDISDGDFGIQNVPPTIACNATDGPGPGSCERLVTFDATVTDDCAVDASAVSVNVSLTAGNPTLGVPSVNKTQVNSTTVTISGSVLVSSMTGAPATVLVEVSATDRCGNAVSCSKSVDVQVPLELIALNDIDQTIGVDELLEIPDPNTGVAGLIGSLGDNFIESEALATLPCSGNRVFVVDNDRLLELDPGTGNGLEIGPIGFEDVDGLAFQPQTEDLYGVTYGSNLIVRIDRTTGQGTLVADHVIEGRRLNDLAFHPDGRAFILTDGTPRIYEVDIATGAKLDKWVLTGALSLESLLWSVDGTTLYSAADRDGFKDLVTIALNPGGTGTVTFVSAAHSGYSDIEGLAWVSTQVMALLRSWGSTDVAVAAPHAVVQLQQNAPNPFNPSTQIAFELPKAQEVELVIFDVAGRKVLTLLRGHLEAGSHFATWNGRDAGGNSVATGVYQYTLRGDDWRESRSMVLIK